MCSFDVSSLFTNVPFEETIQICLDKKPRLTTQAQTPRKELKIRRTAEFLFDELGGVWKCDQTVSVVFDITSQAKLC